MIFNTKCARCRHERAFNIQVGAVTCDAYPDGIPVHIQYGPKDIPCSENISFEEKEDKE